VKSRATTRTIPEIRVGIAGMRSFELTDSQGCFYLYAPKEERYELAFEDIDGEENGSFAGTSLFVDLANIGTELTVELAEQDAE
jgi:hypothetical protein